MLGHLAIADGADGVKGVVASVGEDGAAILLVFLAHDTVMHSHDALSTGHCDRHHRVGAAARLLRGASIDARHAQARALQRRRAALDGSDAWKLVGWPEPAATRTIQVDVGKICPAYLLVRAE